MYQGRLSSSTSTPRPSLIVLIRYVYNSIHCILLCGPKSHVFTVYKSVKWDLPNMMILAPWTNVVSHQLLSPNLRAARVHDSILTLSHMSMWQIHAWIVSHFWREAAVFMCCQHFLPLSSFTDSFTCFDTKALFSVAGLESQKQWWRSMSSLPWQFPL